MDIVSRWVQGGGRIKLNPKFAGGLVELNVEVGSSSLVEESMGWVIKNLESGVLPGGIAFNTDLRLASIEVLANAVSSIQNGVLSNLLLRDDVVANGRCFLRVAEIAGLVIGHALLYEVASVRLHEATRLSLALAILASFKGTDEAATTVHNFVQDSLNDDVRSKLVSKLGLSGYVESTSSAIEYFGMLSSESVALWNLRDWTVHVSNDVLDLMDNLKGEEGNIFKIIVDTLSSTSKVLETTSCVVVATCAYIGIPIVLKHNSASCIGNEKVCIFSNEYPDLERMSYFELEGARYSIADIQGLMDALVVRDAGQNVLQLARNNLTHWLNSKKVTRVYGRVKTDDNFTLKGNIPWKLVGKDDIGDGLPLALAVGNQNSSTARGRSWLENKGKQLEAARDIGFSLPNITSGLETVSVWMIVSSWCSVVTAILHNPEELILVRTQGDFPDVVDGMICTMESMQAEVGMSSGGIFATCADIGHDENSEAAYLGVQSMYQIITFLSNTAGSSNTFNKLRVLPGQILGCPGKSLLDGAVGLSTLSNTIPARVIETISTTRAYIGEDVACRILPMKMGIGLELSMVYNVRNGYISVPYDTVVQAVFFARYFECVEIDDTPVLINTLSPADVIVCDCSRISSCIIMSHNNESARMACINKLRNRENVLVWTDGSSMARAKHEVDKGFVIIA